MCVVKKKLGNIIGLLIIVWIGFYCDFKKGLSILEYDFFFIDCMNGLSIIEYEYFFVCLG